MQRPITLLSLTMTLLLGACGDGKNTTDDTDATDATTTGATGTNPTDSTAATETLGMSSAPTTGDDGTAGTTTTGQTDSTTGDGSTGGTSGNLTEPPTTGEPADIMTLCQNFCEKNEACMGAPPAEVCTAGCVDDLGDREEPCKSASDEFLVCLANMTCEELSAFANDDDPGPCTAQVDAQSEACSDQACTAGIGTSEDGTECSYQVSCPDEPAQEINCGPDTCQCITGGMESGSCPNDADVCMSLELEAKAKECCGF